MSNFAWPLAAFACFAWGTLLFRRPLGELISRIKRLAHGNTALEIADPEAAARKQQNAKAADPLPVLPASHALPPQSELYRPTEQQIESALTKLNRPPEVDRAWMIRVLATLNFQIRHERAYRLIFGSQLTLLLQANTGSPPDRRAAREIYDQATVQYPLYYSQYTFEQWLDFPISIGLITAEGTAPIFRVTPLGRDFLNYLVNQGLTQPKGG